MFEISLTVVLNGSHVSICVCLAFESTSGRYFVVSLLLRDLLQSGCVSESVREYSVMKEPFPAAVTENHTYPRRLKDKRLP